VVVLGIDIGSTQIKAGMVDEQGAIVASRTIPTPADLDGFLPALQDADTADLFTEGRFLLIEPELSTTSAIETGRSAC